MNSHLMTDLKQKLRNDEKSKRFLSTLEDNHGEATITEIRAATGLTRREANYRFQKLSELGLVNITRDEEKAVGNREPPKTAHLTGTARREIERGLLGEGDSQDEDTKPPEISRSEWEKMWKTIHELERRVNVMTQGREVTINQEGHSDESGMVERVDQLADRVDDIESRMDSVSTEPASSNTAKHLNRRLNAIEEDLDALEAYIFEWDETAQTYLLAMRRAIEEELGLDLCHHIDVVEDEVSSVREV